MVFENEQRQLLLESVNRLVYERIQPRAAEIDATNEFPRDIFEAMGELGIFGLWIPEEFGGVQSDLTTTMLVVERIAEASATCALIFANCGEASLPIILGGSQSAKEVYLPRIVSGELIPCFALTEPSAGSDVAAIATKAVRDGGSYCLSGRKVFCTNGSVGGVYIVFASTDPSARSRGISAFLVPREADGLMIGKDEDLIGLKGSPTSEVILDDVEVPVDARLGDEGDGFRLAMIALDEARLNASAMSLGLASAALEHAVNYAKERVQFDRPIIEHQGLQFLLSEMTTDIAAGWALFQQAVELLEKGRSPKASTYASMAKVFCTDVAMKATVNAVQVFGGYGLSKNYPVERLMRDAKAYQIFDGTNQIQKMIIGRYLQQAGVPIPRP